MTKQENPQEQDTINLLQTLKETPARDPDQAARVRQAFLAQAAEMSAQPVSISLFQRLINVLVQPKPQRRFSTLTIGLMLGMLLLTFSSSAIAARLSKPDQAFYPYKLWLENSRLSLTTKPDNQIDLHLVFAEERLKELAEGFDGYSDEEAGRAILNLSDHIQALQGYVDDDRIPDEQQNRWDAILDQYEQYDDDDDDEPEVEEETEKDDSLSGSEDDESNPADDEPEEQDAETDAEDEAEDDQVKHRKETEASQHPKETDEPDDDQEVESTDEPDEDSDDEADSPEEEPTDTPEPTKTPKPTETPEPDDD